MREEWRDIPGYINLYEVSNMGRIKRVGKGRGAMVGRIIRGCVRGKGYLSVDLSRDDCKRRFGVHQLVAMAFIGLPPTDEYEVNHKDLDKINNVPGNLEWMTSKENVHHALAHGKHGGRPLPGEQNGRAKLTKEQIVAIRNLKGIVGARVIAKQFGVSRSAIQLIHQEKNWKISQEWPEDLQVRQMPEVRYA